MPSPAPRRVQIHRMQPADLDRVTAIDAAAFAGTGWPRSAFAGELEQNTISRYYVAVDPGEAQIVGYLGLWAVADEVHIVTIAVDPAFQGRSYGEALLLQAFATAWAIRAETLTLECRESNAAALGLYRKYGLEVAGRRRRYYRDNNEDALILSLHGVDDAAVRARVAAGARALREQRGLIVETAEEA